MASDAGQPAGTTADSYAHTERVGFGIIMIVAPLVVLAATIIHPPHGAENGAEYYQAALDHSQAFYVAHTLFFFGAVFLLPATVGLARLLQRSRHGKAAFWGGLLSLMGFIGWGALDGMDFMTYVAGSSSNLDTNTMQTYIDDALANTAILVPVSIVFFLLIIGLCVIAVGLHRAAIIPLWLALLMPIGILGVISFLEYPPLLIGSALLLLASFGTVGVRQLRAPDATAAQAAPI